MNPAPTNLCESTGMALSVSRGQSFIVLFIAIVFHRTYALLVRLGFPWSSIFSAHVMAYSQFILLLVFGQRGDLGGESRYYRTRFLSPSQFVRPWVLHSLLTISLQKRSRALGLVHGLPCSSFRANQSFVEYGSLARLSPRLWHSRTGSPLRLGKPLALRYYFPQGHRTIPHQGLH